MAIREDYNRALELAKRGKYVEARQLLLPHQSHPKVEPLLKKVNQALLAQRDTPDKKKRNNTSDKQDKPGCYQRVRPVIGFVLGFIIIRILIRLFAVYFGG